MNTVWYAHTQARRTRQIASDIWMALWTVGWIWVGVKLHDLLLLLAKPGEALVSSGEKMAENMESAGDRVADVPLVSDRVRSPFDRMSEASSAIAQAGRDQQEIVGDVATFLGVVVAVIPISLLLLFWLPRRLRFIREATASMKFINDVDDVDLFALRAIANQPMTVLAAIDSDPAGAWRRGEQDTIRALAEVELKAAGLRLPPALPST